MSSKHLSSLSAISDTSGKYSISGPYFLRPIRDVGGLIGRMTHDFHHDSINWIGLTRPHQITGDWHCDPCFHECWVPLWEKDLLPCWIQDSVFPLKFFSHYWPLWDNSPFILASLPIKIHMYGMLSNLLRLVWNIPSVSLLIICLDKVNRHPKTWRRFLGYCHYCSV